MAMLFCDSFDHYVTADISKKWTGIASAPYADPTIGATGRRSTQGVRWTVPGSGPAQQATAKPLLYTNTGASGDTCVVGFSFKASAFGNVSGGTTNGPNYNHQPAAFVGTHTGILYILSSTTYQVWFGLDNTGHVVAYNGTSTLGTSSWTMTGGTTYYLEFKVKINNSTGTVEVRKDGVAGMTLTSQDTQNAATATWDNVAIGHFANDGASVTYDIDDLYISDGSGSSPWSDFLGDVRVDATYPNANGSNSAWTRSTGSDQYATVDEALLNSDTDYNSTATVNAVDTLNFPNAPVAGALIYGLQVCLTHKKEDAGASVVKAVTRISGVDNVGATAMASASSYLVGLQMWQRTPESSPQDWTDTTYNAAEFGYKKTS